MEVIEGAKRFSKVYVDKNNYAYRVNRKFTEIKVFLRCCDDKCQATGTYLLEENCFNPKTKHNHSPDILFIGKMKFLQALKMRAETEDKNLFTIYKEECLNYPSVDHPPFDQVKSTLWKRRKVRKTSKILEEKPKVNLLPFEDGSKGQLEQDFNDAGDMHFDEELKVVPQIFSEFVPQYSPEGNIVEIVEGPKRFSKVFVDDVGYAYQMNKRKKDGGIFLRCHTEGCSGTGIFDPGTTQIRRLAPHFHNPNQDAVQKLRFLQKVKMRAETETTSLNTIYSEEASRFHGTPLPSFDKIKSTLRKRRVANLLQKTSSRPLSPSLDLLSNGKEGVATHYIARKGMEVIEGPKRFSKIYIDDFSYCYLVNRKKDDGSLILRCHEEGCRGSGRFDPSESVFHKMAKHSHYADPLLVTKWRFLHQCKKRAETEKTPIKLIYEQESHRHPNCNLPSFKKIESTLQKRRKSYQCKEEEGHQAMKLYSVNSDSPPATLNLEVQLEEVYHPEGNPHYFLSPNISYEAPPPIQVKDENPAPMPILVRTGKVQKLNFPQGKALPMPNFSKEPLKKNLKTLRKKTRKRKRDTLKLKRLLKLRRIKSMEPRKPSNYSSKMELMEGTKRFSKIFIDECQHIYQLNKSRLDGVLILKCYGNGCHGSGLYFPSREVFQRSAEHNHNPSPDTVAKCRLLNSLKVRAENESAPLRVIYDEEVAKYPGIEIPSFRQMESTLQKRRRAKIPSEPQSLREAALQLQRTDFSKCPRGNFFRRYLNVEDQETLVFVSPGLLEEKFREGTAFHLDCSSFKVIPQGFAQILVVHLVVMDHAFPVVYALLNTKSRKSYVGFFEFLKSEFLEFDPRFVSSDFERELEEAFQVVFPNAIVTGTWFHYTQCIWRQLRTCGLARVFFQDEEAKMIMKCAMALPLLPAVRIPDGVRFLQDRISEAPFHLKETKNSLFKIIEFIEDEWIQRIGLNRFSVFGMERKLNYDLEAVCQFFIKKLGVERPSLIKFVEKMFQVESIILSDFKKKLLGKPIRADRSRRCNESEKRLKEIYCKFEGNIIDVGGFLLSASSSVPRHCHHDDVICNEEDEASSQDPSDIPGSLPFLEIRVMAPEESSSHFNDTPLSPIKLEALPPNETPSLLIGDLKVEPNFQPLPTLPVDGTHSNPSHSGHTESKEFIPLENVWPVQQNSAQPQYILSQVSPMHFTSDLHPTEHGSTHSIVSGDQQMQHSHQQRPEFTLQHISPDTTEPHHANSAESHISDPNLQITEAQNICQVRLVDNKTGVFLY